LASYTYRPGYCRRESHRGGLRIIIFIHVFIRVFIRVVE